MPARCARLANTRFVWMTELDFTDKTSGLTHFPFCVLQSLSGETSCNECAVGHYQVRLNARALLYGQMLLTDFCYAILLGICRAFQGKRPAMRARSVSTKTPKGPPRATRALSVVIASTWAWPALPKVRRHARTHTYLYIIYMQMCVCVCACVCVHI